MQRLSPRADDKGGEDGNDDHRGITEDEALQDRRLQFKSVEQRAVL